MFSNFYAGRSALAMLIVLASLASPVLAEELYVSGFAAVRGSSVDGPPSWLEGGFGRLRWGADSADDSAVRGAGEIHLGLDWQPTERFGAHLHATARGEPSELEGRAAGIVEAYVYYATRVRELDNFELRAGHFFLPTSRENVDFAWASPYTLSFSAVNTWVAEELRLTGLLAEYRLAVGAADEVRLGLSAFGGNDAMGALLAWRGFSFGDRLGVFGEHVPLPPLDSLAPGGAFAEQSGRGTQPFGSDLDGRAGYAGYLRWQRPERAVVQVTRLENPADRELHDGEYAWESELDLFALDLQLSPEWTLVGEHLRGETGMGKREADHAQLDFEAAYLLISWSRGPWRLSLRRDELEIVDRDRSAAEINDEEGDAWTLALFWQPRERLRLGIEYLDVDALRPAAAESGFDPRTDASALTFELRWRLGVL